MDVDDLEDEIFSVRNVNKDKLLNLVHQHPYLFKKQHQDFSNRKLKDKAWAMIGEEFGITAKEIIIKFRSMKDRFVKLHREQLAAKRSGRTPKEITWPYYIVLYNMYTGSGPQNNIEISNVTTVDESEDTDMPKSMLEITNVTTVDESDVTALHEPLITITSALSDTQDDHSHNSDPDPVDPDQSQSGVINIQPKTKNTGLTARKLFVPVLRRLPAKTEKTLSGNASAETNFEVSQNRTREQDDIYYFTQMIDKRLRALPRRTQLSLMMDMMQQVTEAGIELSNDNDQNNRRAKRRT